MKVIKVAPGSIPSSTAPLESAPTLVKLAEHGAPQLMKIALKVGTAPDQLRRKAYRGKPS